MKASNKQPERDREANRQAVLASEYRDRERLRMLQSHLPRLRDEVGACRETLKSVQAEIRALQSNLSLPI